MKPLQSHNSQSRGSLISFIIPGPIQILLYILSGLIILALINARAVWEYLYKDPVGQQRAVDLFANGSANKPASGLLSSSLPARISQILVWTIIGIIIYSVIWFIKNLFNNIRNDIVADEYVHPKNYNRAGYWRSILLRKVFFVFTATVFVGFVYTLIKILPLISNIFYQSLKNFKLSGSGKMLGASLFLALLIHLLVVIIRMMASSWRFIYADL